MSAADYFKNYFTTIDLKTRSVDFEQLKQCASLIQQTHLKGRKLFIVGNGGSAAMASHLTVDFLKSAKIRAMNFNEADLITCFSNDYGYEHWVEKAVEFYGDKGDVFIGYSTSGQSPNVLLGFEEAQQRNIKTIGLTGKRDGAMRELCDYLIEVPSLETAKIQEGHLVLGHIICGLVEQAIFKVAE